jgi:hypothetical protein
MVAPFEAFIKYILLKKWDYNNDEDMARALRPCPRLLYQGIDLEQQLSSVHPSSCHTE